MKLRLERILIFCQNMPLQTQFYQEVLGLAEVTNPDDPDLFVEFEAGACRIALHSGGVTSKAKRPPKLVFFAQDVQAAREWLVARGAKMGKPKKTDLELHDGSYLILCDGRDPEGNPFQLSNRN